jgi:hypothetical protein
MQNQMFKLHIFHKLDWQIDFHNQKTHLFKELFFY